MSNLAPSIIEGMNSSSLPKLACAAISMAATALCHADITAFGASFYADVEQAADGFPGAVPYTSAIYYITSNPFSDANGAELNGPAGTVPFYFVGEGILYCTNGSTIGFPGLQGLWPTGTYSYDVNSGAFAGQSGTFNIPSHDFAFTTPYFLGTGYSQMQLCTAGVPKTVNWLPGSAPAGYSDAYASITLVDYTKDYLLYTNYGPIGSYTSQTLDGSVLRSGHHCVLQVDYVSSYTGPVDPVFGIAPVRSFLRRTYQYFQVQASPGTVAGVFHLGQVGSPNFENFSVDVLDSSGNVLESHDLQTGYYGYYAFDSALRGTYSVRYRTPKFISRIIHNVDFAAGENNIVAELPNGDIDENGEVGIGDYLILAEYFDRDAATDPDWATVLGQGFAPREADISRDSEVGLTDYLILVSNFDLVSE